jgi:mono/diheme cytochrome c family protein
MTISKFRNWASVVACGVTFAGFSAAHGAEPKPPPGLTATIKSGAETDIVAVPAVGLYVEVGKSPTPFLPAGKFSATWEGAVNADLRGNFSFQAELNGNVQVEINGVVILEASSAGGASPLTKPVQLNKGGNPFKATFTSPAAGDAFVRLAWTEKGTNTAPIPPTAFTRTTTPELEKASGLRLGRELFLEHRCVKCHTDNNVVAAGVPELKMDAPSLEGIGARRNFDWMTRWILDPKSLRPSARMPKVLHGASAKEDAEAVAAYLASLKTGGEPKFATVSYQTKQDVPKKEGDEPAPAGEVKPLYERLHCIGCHNPPDATQPDPTKLSQKRIAEKFPRGALAEYLRAPAASYTWTRMPDFHLSAAEAKELEEFLFNAAPKPELKPAPTDAAVLEKGKKLVQTTGCLNCHALKLENQFRLPAGGLGMLYTRHLKDRAAPANDCLGAKPFADYVFSAEEKAALERFTLAGAASLSRHVPADFAGRQTRSLNCNACHGQLEGFPPLELLGGKLKPEWMTKFIGGDIPHKMRFDAHPQGMVWLEARMPAFRSRAADLATGLAAEQGFPPKSAREVPVNLELAKAGQKIVGKDGGLQCVVCHGVGTLLATDVFESEGINLAWSADRLLPSFYRRWVRSPTSVDPQTKMPVFFEEPKTALTEILDGDSEQQVSAIWEYIRLREKMPAPKLE